jgi:fatty-acyl-CoA synthase
VKTVTEALAAAARSSTGIRAIEHDGRSIRISYVALLVESLTIAGALGVRGLVPGDRVAIIIPEVHDFILAFFGLSAAGLVPVPLCAPAQAGDLATFARRSRHVLATARVAAIIASPDVAPLLDVSGLEPRPAILSIDALRDGSPIPHPVPLDGDACALLQFTSGSTAEPKGVVLTHANLYANISSIAGPAGLGVGRHDVAVSWLPLYHDMGLIALLLGAMYTALDIVVMSPILFLKRPTAWLEAISTYRGTVSFAPNFAYELCLRRVKAPQIEALDLSSWRVAGCGAEPIRSDTLEAFARYFAAAGFRASSFVPSYGLAEHSVAVALALNGVRVDTVDARRLVQNSVAAPARNGASAVKVVSCGCAFPGHEIGIVDARGRTVPERHVGSIVTRGPSVMRGYFADAAATVEALRDGWLHTGDLGYIADGELFVCGRTKDVIIRQGRKYHPPDLESAIADLPGLRSSSVVVFGITRFDESDEVVAVLEARASFVSDELKDRVRRRVREAAGIDLDRVVVAPPGTIPRTTSGKVRRAETRARLQAGTLVAARPSERSL